MTVHNVVRRYLVLFRNQMSQSLQDELQIVQLLQSRDGRESQLPNQSVGRSLGEDFGPPGQTRAVLEIGGQVGNEKVNFVKGRLRVRHGESVTMKVLDKVALTVQDDPTDGVENFLGRLDLGLDLKEGLIEAFDVFDLFEQKDKDEESLQNELSQFLLISLFKGPRQHFATPLGVLE